MELQITIWQIISIVALSTLFALGALYFYQKQTTHPYCLFYEKNLPIISFTAHILNTEENISQDYTRTWSLPMFLSTFERLRQNPKNVIVFSDIKQFNTGSGDCLLTTQVNRGGKEFAIPEVKNA